MGKARISGNYMSIEFAKIVIIVDNNRLREDLETRWGLSIYVETPYNKILFDTDTDPNVLARNAGKLGIDLSNIDCVVISHAHGDHTGGLRILSEYKPGLLVYTPKHANIESYVRRLGLTPRSISQTVRILTGVYVIGELSRGGFGLWEQALGLKVKEKLIVLTGCSHPGLDKIVEKALNDVGGRLYIVLGGFHDPSSSMLDSVIELGADKIYPLHCSGRRSIRYLKENYPEKLGIGGAGLELYIK